MPDVIAPGHIRAQAVFQGASLLPEDRFVNTFTFRTGNLGEDPVVAGDFTTIAAALVDFYNVAGPSGNSVQRYMSADIVRSADAAEIRMYDLGNLHPRPPHVVEWTVGANALNTRLPSEAAIVGSFYGFRNIPRQRGRIYVGPLNLDALNQANGRPADGARQAIAEAMGDLIGSTGVIDWVVLSTVPPGFTSIKVSNGWVDNAFDTQRRRGIATTSRIVF